jgi:hypothetical protein
MNLMRLVMIGMFSISALTLFTYQSTEIFNAFMEFFREK